jgi:exonuclease VII large subunit
MATLERKRRTTEERLRYFDLRPRLRHDRERWNDLSVRTATLMRLQLNQRRGRLEKVSAKLGQLDARLVLSRGYAIVLNEREEIVRAPADAPRDTHLKILLSKGELKAWVEE